MFEDTERSTSAVINREHRNLNVNKNFTKIRFDLSEGAELNVSDGPNKVDFSFKGFWVADSSNKDFEAYIKVNPKVDVGSPLRLKPNMSLDFNELQDGCVLEFPAQTGKWIDVYFSHKSAIDSGSIELDQSGSVVTYEGETFELKLETVTATPSELVSGDSSRVITTIENRGGVDIYLGDSLTLGLGDFQDRSILVPAGGYIKWKNRSGLYARTSTGSNSKIFINEERV